MHVVHPTARRWVVLFCWRTPDRSLRTLIDPVESFGISSSTCCRKYICSLTCWNIVFKDEVVKSKKYSILTPRCWYSYHCKYVGTILFHWVAIDGMDNGRWAVLRWFCICYVIGVIRVKFFDWNTCHLQGIEACQTDITMTHNSNRSREKSGQYIRQ